MALWRISLVLAAVFFGPTSCARLKKSATQRRLAEAALLRSSAPDQTLVSDKLMDQKDKIGEFIAEHEANLEKNELEVLPDLVEKHKQAVKEYDSYTDWWLKKAWYEFWSEDKLKELEQKRDALHQRIITTRDLIASIKESIKNLKDAQNWTHDNAEKAKAYERDINELSTQLALAKQDHESTVDNYQTQQRLAKENSDREDEAHEEQLADLSKDIEEQNGILARLQDGTHDLHVELKNTKNSLQQDIAKHEKAIQEFQAQIKAYNLEIEGAEKNRKQEKKGYERKLKKLHDHIAALKADIAEEQKALAAGKVELEKAITEGNAKIEDLKKELQEAIATLEEQVAASHKRVVNQKKVNEDVILSAQAKFKESVDTISRQIEDFTSAKEASLKELDELRKTHGEEATDAVVSETLHKAKVDLGFKLKLETNARDTAASNIHDMEVEFARLNAEIESLSKWYNGWWHRWISRKLPPLQRNQGFLKIEIYEEKRRKDHCTELISQLSAQIESKLNASELAEVEEAALGELEKQITEKQDEKKKEMQANTEALRLEKEAGDDAVQTLRDHEAGLRSKENTVKAELQQLENGAHDAHDELEVAKAAINDILETHEQTIQGLSGVLTIAEHDELELRENEQRADNKHATAIEGLNELRQGMTDQKHSQEAHKQTKDAELKKFESDQTTRIEDLRGLTEETIADLKQFKADAEDSHANAKIKLKDIQQLKEREHQMDIDSLEAEINSMKDSKSETAELLKEIEEANPHGA